MTKENRLEKIKNLSRNELENMANILEKEYINNDKVKKSVELLRLLSEYKDDNEKKVKTINSYEEYYDYIEEYLEIKKTEKSKFTAADYFKHFTNEALREIITIAKNLNNSKIIDEIIEACTNIMNNNPNCIVIDDGFNNFFTIPDYLNIEVNSFIEIKKEHEKRLELKHD